MLFRDGIIESSAIWGRLLNRRLIASNEGLLCIPSIEVMPVASRLSSFKLCDNSNRLKSKLLSGLEPMESEDRFGNESNNSFTTHWTLFDTRDIDSTEPVSG